MKNKKVSAFAVFKSKTEGVRTKPMKATRSNSQQQNTRQRRSSTTGKPQNGVSVEQPQSKKRRQGHRNLERSPMVYHPKRNISCPNVTVEINKAVAEKAMEMSNRKKAKRMSQKRQKLPANGLDSSDYASNSSEKVKTKQEVSCIVTDHEEKDDDSVKMIDDASTPFHDSLKEAERCFTWLIYPVKPKNFFADIWEKKPLLVKRQHNPIYYKGIFSSSDLDTILREKTVLFGKNIDITSYVNGERKTHTPEGRAHAPVVWDYYQNGCSVRLLNPQTFSKSVWRLNSILQEYFGSCVGANIYLTPPGTQGFAPHYDDIEAFILQLEGRKRWKVYAPRSPVETLPRYSSDNLKSDELGENILNVELEPGDLLYFPRGYIHQASPPNDTHSLHITVSASQRNTWGDYLEKLIPRALQIMFENDIEFRRSMPRDYMRHLGVAHSDVVSPSRENFLGMLKTLMTKLTDNLPVDACADQMAKNYVHDCLPPVLTKAERAASIYGSNTKWQDGKIINFTELNDSDSVKLTRGNILRLVTEDNALRVYYSMENSREYHGEEPQFLEIVPEMAQGVEFLLHSYPNFVKIYDLPVENSEDRVTLATALYEQGLLVTAEPL